MKLYFHKWWQHGATIAALLALSFVSLAALADEPPDNQPGSEDSAIDQKGDQQPSVETQQSGPPDQNRDDPGLRRLRQSRERFIKHAEEVESRLEKIGDNTTNEAMELEEQLKRLRRAVQQIDNLLRSMSVDVGPRDKGQLRDIPNERDEGPQKDGDRLEKDPNRHVREIRTLAEKVKAAGFARQAELLRRQADDIANRMNDRDRRGGAGRPHDGPAQIRQLRGEFHALRRDVNGLRHDVREIRRFLNMLLDDGHDDDGPPDTEPDSDPAGNEEAGNV